MNLPATTLKDAFNACDPSEPLSAGDERYVDLAPGRGDERGAVGQCCRRILISNRPLVQLFGGHRGCGKSTELRRLQERLEGEGYFVVYVEAENDIDLEDTEPVDVLLSLVRSVHQKLVDDEIEIPEEQVDEFMLWFAEVVLETTDRREIAAEVVSEAEVSGRVLFAKLLARFRGWIKTGRESKRRVRQSLDPQMSQLLERTSLLIGSARSEIEDRGFEGLVVIVDSLDRVALKPLPDGRTSHEVLFVERGDLLKGLGCHTVITVPISLLFSPQLPGLKAIFPDQHLLPMVKIQQPATREPWPEGEQLMLDLLAQRIELGTALDVDVARDLVRASGGHPRILVLLVRYALDFVDELPITREAAAIAIRRLTNDYGRSIPEQHWSLLAEVHREQQVKNDTEHQQMLFNLSVLEYQNERRWCDVQPTVLRLPPFQRALAAARETGESRRSE